MAMKTSKRFTVRKITEGRVKQYSSTSDRLLHWIGCFAIIDATTGDVAKTQHGFLEIYFRRRTAEREAQYLELRRPTKHHKEK